jgi:signal transduction histidine kinase
LGLSARNREPDHPDAAPSVSISRVHLQHAINNLVHNAIKYSLPSDVERQCVEIDGYPRGAHYCIHISNSGIGILPNELTAIFEDGFQGKLARERYRTGSGKGLYFVKQVVDRHNGTIYAESTSLDGPRYTTRFVVSVPRLR